MVKKRKILRSGTWSTSLTVCWKERSPQQDTITLRHKSQVWPVGFLSAFFVSKRTEERVFATTLFGFLLLPPPLSSTMVRPALSLAALLVLTVVATFCAVASAEDGNSPRPPSYNWRMPFVVFIVQFPSSYTQNFSSSPSLLQICSTTAQ